MFVACGIWCLADVWSVSPSSEQKSSILKQLIHFKTAHQQKFFFSKRHFFSVLSLPSLSLSLPGFQHLYNVIGYHLSPRYFFISPIASDIYFSFFSKMTTSQTKLHEDTLLFCKNVFQLEKLDRLITNLTELLKIAVYTGGIPQWWHIITVAKPYLLLLYQWALNIAFKF